MDIRNGMDGLKTLLGVPATTPAQAQQVKSEKVAGATPLAGDHATLSSAGAEVAQIASESDARMDKVASVQAALAARSYSVPASAVASKVVEAMLGGETNSGK
jgi:negative regulator of flagellin synthesis FlgM